MTARAPRRHRLDKVDLNRFDTPVTDRSRDPDREARDDMGRRPASITGPVAPVPWTTDDLPWCPSCGEHVGDGCSPGCEWALGRAA